MTASPHPRLLACAGLIGAPAAWAVASELGLILPYAECGSHLRPLLIASILLTAAAATSGVMSWRAAWHGRTGHFVRLVFALLAASLAFALVLDVLAGLVLTGCER